MKTVYPPNLRIRSLIVSGAAAFIAALVTSCSQGAAPGILSTSKQQNLAAVPTVVAEFPIPTNNSFPQGITAGPDGNLWFTELIGDKIGRITTTGSITEFALPATPNPFGIAPGPDGNLWFAENGSPNVGRITTAGSISEFPVSSRNLNIVAGPDGNMWFTELSKIGRITTTGSLSEFSVSIGLAGPVGITPGPDGNLWFTAYTGNSIGRITTTGSISEFALPKTCSQPYGIAAGPDGNLWFTEGAASKIGKGKTNAVWHAKSPSSA